MKKQFWRLAGLAAKRAGKAGEAPAETRKWLARMAAARKRGRRPVAAFCLQGGAVFTLITEASHVWH